MSWDNTKKKFYAAHSSGEKKNLSVEWIINHFVATQPLSGINSRDLQSICPSLKISESCLDIQIYRVFHKNSRLKIMKDPVLTAYLVDVHIVGDCVVTDGVVAEPLHGDQGGVVPLTKEN